jgi:hypothetical protein
MERGWGVNSSEDAYTALNSIYVSTLRPILFPSTIPEVFQQRRLCIFLLEFLHDCAVLSFLVVDEVSASDIIPESSSERAERYRKDQKEKQKYIWTTKGMGEDFFTFLRKNQEKCTNTEHLYRLGGCLYLFYSNNLFTKIATLLHSRHHISFLK